MLQISLVLPALWVAIASFANLSSLPAETSLSISLSHSSESYLRNQSRNAASSSGLSRWTSFSNFSTFVITINLRCYFIIISFINHGLTIEIRRGGTDHRQKATGLFPVALIEMLCVPSYFIHVVQNFHYGQRMDINACLWIKHDSAVMADFTVLK
jgi:hypothetical protein